MRHSIPVVPAPAPVMPTQINIDVMYIVVRGDGYCKVFQSLYDRDSVQRWESLASKNVDAAMLLIPIDLFTATRLGIVAFSELELPEAMQALIHMIK